MLSGLIIIPKKASQNTTKILDKDKIRDKVRTTSATEITTMLSTEKSLSALSEEYFNELINKTHFRSDNLTAFTTQVGSIVQIPCRVHLVGDEVVSLSNFRQCLYI